MIGGSERRSRPRLAAALFLLASIVPPAAGFGGDLPAVQALTLEEARSIALENNRDILKALEYRNRVVGRYVEERAAALPQVVLSTDAVRSWDSGQKAFGGTPEARTLTALAGASQPLYTWGQIGAAIRAAKVGVATADDQLRLFRQAALRDVTAAFHDVLLARELSAIAAQNRDQKERLLGEARKRFAVGTATDYDVLVATVALENARPDVIRAENLVRASRDRLRFLLGRDGLDVDARGNLETAVETPPSYREALEAARVFRPELSDLRHRIEVSNELVTIAKAGDKPRLDLRGGFGWKDVETGFADADGKVWSAGLFATWPVFDGFRTRGRVAQARSDVATLRIEEKKLLESIELQVRDGVNAVREAGEIVVALSGTAGQAERLLAMAEKGYEYGVKTKLDVDDAQLNLTQARGNLARGRRDYLVARVTLEYLQGTLGEVPGKADGGERRWEPAGGALGLVREVIAGEPRLHR